MIDTYGCMKVLFITECEFNNQDNTNNILKSDIYWKMQNYEIEICKVKYKMQKCKIKSKCEMMQNGAKCCEIIWLFVHDPLDLG